MEESRGIEHKSCPAAEPSVKACSGLFGMICVYFGGKAAVQGGRTELMEGGRAP